MNKLIDRTIRISKDAALLTVRRSIPLLYFNNEPNVGDLVSVYLVERLGRKPTHRVNSIALPHLTAVGSTIGSSSKASYIWGSGSINGKRPFRSVDPAKIFALRGMRTKELLEKITGQMLNVPLGDPAILMPDFYDRSVPISHSIGIVPHFDEFATVKRLLKNGREEVKLIDPRQSPETFMDEIRSCKAIMSSSLHGLILANAYEIPTIWFSATDALIGGQWKFHDYYSASDAPEQSPVLIKSEESFLSALQFSEKNATCHRMKVANKDLISAFPERFIG